MTSEARVRAAIRLRRAIRLTATMVVLGGVSVPLVFGSSPVYAAGTTLYIAPGTASVRQDQNLAVAVRLDPGGDSINAVEAHLAFDVSRFEYISTSFADSAFSNSSPTTGNNPGGGVLKIGRFSLGSPVTVDALVATVTFKSLVASGSTQITFGPSSALDSNTSAEQLDDTVGGSYELTAPPAPAPPPAATTDTLSPSPTAKPTPIATAKPKIIAATPSPTPATIPAPVASPELHKAVEPQNSKPGPATNQLESKRVASSEVLWGSFGLVAVIAVITGALFFLKRRHVNTPLPSSQEVVAARPSTDEFLSRRQPPQVGRIIVPQSGAVVTAHLPSDNKPLGGPL